MDTSSLVQTWRRRVGSYRLASEPINTSAYDVALIPDDTTARNFVVQHHYAGTFPAARARSGLYRAGILVGVIVVSVPMHDAVLAPLHLPREECGELGRVVLLDEPKMGNAESWFLAQSFRLFRNLGFRGFVSDADPMQTLDASGQVVCRGHLGTIYQASNAVYIGQTERRTRYLLPNGHVFVQRQFSKVRGREKGWEGAAAVLERFGAPHLGERDDAQAWLDTWVPRLTRRVRHPGNHRYLFGLDKFAKKGLPTGKAYPKIEVGTLFAA